MKSCEQNFENSRIDNSSEEDYMGEMKNQEIKHLLKTKINFDEFLASLGSGSKVALSSATARYSREILTGHFAAQEIRDLIEKRVDKMIKNHRIKKNWCKEDCTILAWILEKITNGKHLRSPQKIKMSYWETVASLIPGVGAQECMFKWLSMKKTKLGSNKWSETESKILQKITKQNGTADWKNISRMVFLQNRSDDKKYRSPKQCREQWNCYLNPAVKKGSWSVEEDIRLLKEVEKSGRRWSFICRQAITGRTENAIKNRYNFLIQHKKQKYPDHDEDALLHICLRQLQETLLQAPEIKKQVQNEPEEGASQVENNTKPQPKIQHLKMQQQGSQQYQQVTIVQCNYEQIANFMKNNNILIPAKIEKNQLIAFNGYGDKTMKVKYEGSSILP